MSSSVSPVCVVRISVVLLHVSLVRNSGDKEPESNADKDSLPDGRGDLVPHLLVEHVDLLQSPDIVFFAWSVGECPNSEVVHVSHLGPGVLE